MTRDYLLKITAELSESSPANYLDLSAVDEATRQKLSGDYDGLRFFEPPILSVGSAFDPGFMKLKEPGVVGPHHMLPTDWLPEAKSVISLFLPHTERTIKSNTLDPREPSYEWLFGRIEGQQQLLATGLLVRDALIENGFKAHLPYTDKRLMMRVAATQTDIPIPVFSSNWSERHVAYVSGLGTFGRMTNFISKRGTCGRLISVVTDWAPEPDVKDYSGLYDYCAECYACYRACPGDAFDENGKDIHKCSGFLRENCVKYLPRYACGKCQTGLPCSTTRLNKVV